MANETAVHAAYKSIYAALTAGTPVWDARVYPDVAPPNAAMPYVVYFLSGGGEDNDRIIQDATLSITVKAVANTMTGSMEAAQTISATLNDAGAQEAATVSGHMGWQISTISQGETFHLVEMFEGVTPIYHDGHIFTLIMEEI